MSWFGCVLFKFCVEFFIKLILEELVIIWLYLSEFKVFGVFGKDLLLLIFYLGKWEKFNVGDNFVFF